MKLSQYGYEFSPEMLAKYPTENRDDARLMVINRAKGTIEHRIFKDIIDYFEEKDLFVFNDTKVFPARLYGNKEKTGAEIEIFLLRELNRELRLWDVLVDPARKIRIGNKLYFGDDDLLVAEVIDNTTSRGRTLRFLFDGSYEEFKRTLFSLGETPLPKWVREKVEPEDAERYQTIFARHEGAVAAPTAGMHFSKHLLKRMYWNISISGQSEILSEGKSGQPVFQFSSAEVSAAFLQLEYRGAGIHNPQSRIGIAYILHLSRPTLILMYLIYVQCLAATDVKLVGQFRQMKMRFADRVKDVLGI